MMKEVQFELSFEGLVVSSYSQMREERGFK